LFTVNYRITTDANHIRTLSRREFDMGGDLEGFFELDFDGHTYGYCHNRPLQEGERGFELLTNWFSSLLSAYLALHEADYAAISDIESFNTWIELKTDPNNPFNLSASVIRAKKWDGSTYIATRPITNYTYGEWRGVVISQKEFRSESVIKSLRYRNEILAVNPGLSKSERLLELDGLIQKLI